MKKDEKNKAVLETERRIESSPNGIVNFCKATAHSE